jgi:hypothetical protein
VTYPYARQPDFFYDLKLIKVEIDEVGRESYEFDLVMSYAPNPNQTVNYQVAFSTLERSGICRAVEQSAIGFSKHERVACLLPSPNDLFIQLTLVGPEGEQAVEQFRF